MGDVSMLPVGGNDSSVGVGDDLGALYAQFAEHGRFDGSDGQASAAGTGPKDDGGARVSLHRPKGSGVGVSMHGAVSVSASVPAGTDAVVSITFAWHFPDRDYDGEIVGNGYTRLFADSSAVALELGTDAALARVVNDVNAHHGAIAHADNPTPMYCHHLRRPAQTRSPRLALDLAAVLHTLACPCPLPLPLARARPRSRPRSPSPARLRSSPHRAAGSRTCYSTNGRTCTCSYGSATGGCGNMRRGAATT